MKVAFAAILASLAVTASASAADLAARPYTKARPELAPMAVWSGPYIGLSVGWARQDASTTYSTVPTPFALGLFDFAQTLGVLPTSSSQRSDGVLGGLTLGWNFQQGALVYGVEADALGVDLNGRSLQQAAFFGFPDLRTTTTVKTDFLATVRGRLGGLVTPETLLYGTAGLAIGHVKGTTTIEPFLAGSNFATSECATNAFCSTGSSSGFRTGWTAGAGAERQIGGKWTAKLEYLYYDLGRFSHTALESSAAFAAAAGNPNFKADTKITGHVVRAGVNYRF